MTDVKVSMSARWMAVGSSFMAGLLLAAALRYGILENEAQELMCRTDGDSIGCAVRSALGWSIHYQLFGLAGLVLGGVAWLPGMRWAALPGLLLAGCGLFIYNTTYAAVATVIALLAGLRR